MTPPQHAADAPAIRIPPEDRLLPLLRGVETIAPGKWKAYCPYHEADGAEHDPSLHIDKAGDGKLLIHCFACSGTWQQICLAAGITPSELYPDHGQQHDRAGRKGRKGRPQGRKTAEYEYRDAAGIRVYVARRYEADDGSKTFVAGRYDDGGKFVPNIRGVQRVLYRLPELLAADKTLPVYVVEGEKKVDALRVWGQVATCNLGGAGKWAKEYAPFFRGRRVIILPDNDPTDPATGRCPGRDHARKILETLTGVAESVHVLELPGLPPKGDIVDWQASGRTLPQLLELVRDVREWTPAMAAAPKDAEPAPAEMDSLDLRIPESLTDIANGRRLTRKHGADLRYCHPWGKWLVWDDRRWNVDQTGEVMRRAKSVADQLWKELSTMARDIGDDTFKKIIAFCRYTASSKGQQYIAKEASGEPGAQVLPSQLDADQWAFNAANGTVDLRTGELRPHRREDLLTKISPVPFNPDATCPHWERFVLSIMGGKPELVSYVQRLCGYWITGVVREQILPILHGSGANGKTTFLNVVMDVIGPDYVMKAVPDFLMAKRNESHPTDKADLFGKRFVACSETEEGRRLAESLVKELTGAEKIRARRMREDFWEFDATHKLALVTNHRPTVSGTDRGIWRRLRLVPFEVAFWDPDRGEDGPPELRQDKTLPEKLRDEYPGILSWIIRGTLEWLHDGEQVPEIVQIETGSYRATQDVLGVWIDECCVQGSAFAVRATEIYSCYRTWCESMGEFAATQRKFGMSMTERGFMRYTNDGTWYRGITLRSKTEDFS